MRDISSVARRSPKSPPHTTEPTRMRELVGPQLSHGSMRTVLNSIPDTPVAPTWDRVSVNSRSLRHHTMRSTIQRLPDNDLTCINTLTMLSRGTGQRRRQRTLTLSSGCQVEEPVPELVVRCGYICGDEVSLVIFKDNAWPGCSSVKPIDCKQALEVSTGRRRMQIVSSEAFPLSPMFASRHSSSAHSRSRISKTISSDSELKSSHTRLEGRCEANRSKLFRFGWH